MRVHQKQLLNASDFSFNNNKVKDYTTHNPQIRSTNPRSRIYHENCGLCGAFWIETYNPLLIQFYWIFFLNA